MHGDGRSEAVDAISTDAIKDVGGSHLDGLIRGIDRRRRAQRLDTLAPQMTLAEVDSGGVVMTQLVAQACFVRLL